MKDINKNRENYLYYLLRNLLFSKKNKRKKKNIKKNRENYLY